MINSTNNQYTAYLHYRYWVFIAVGLFAIGIVAGLVISFIRPANIVALLSEELAARLNCPDFSLEDPRPGLIERIFDGLIKTDTTKARELRERKIKEDQKEKKGFFRKIKEIFNRKK